MAAQVAFGGDGAAVAGDAVPVVEPAVTTGGEVVGGVRGGGEADPRAHLRRL